MLKPKVIQTYGIKENPEFILFDSNDSVSREDISTVINLGSIPMRSHVYWCRVNIKMVCVALLANNYTTIIKVTIKIQDLRLLFMENSIDQLQVEIRNLVRHSFIQIFKKTAGVGLHPSKNFNPPVWGWMT